MFLIVVGHCIIHGLGLYGISFNSSVDVVTSGSDTTVAIIIYNCCTCAVNCFILISGYFGIKYSGKKLRSLIFTLLFYSLLFNVLPAIVNNEKTEAIRYMLFLSHSPYWFVIDYLILMVIAPVLNEGFERLEKNYLTILIVTLLIASCYLGFLWSHNINTNGYTLSQFVTMYCLGRYISKYSISFSSFKVCSIYVMCSLLVGLAMYLLCHNPVVNPWKMSYYNNPLVIISALALFFLFKNIRYSNRYVNRLALSSLAIYLVQSSHSVSSWMYKIIRHNYEAVEPTVFGVGGGILLYISALSFLVIILAIIIDQVRLRLSKIIIR